MSCPTVRATMATKYPERSHPMPDSVLAGTCIDSLPGLKETLLDLQPGISSGFGGLRNEHLRCAAQHWEEREVSDFELFALEFLNGRLPP